MRPTIRFFCIVLSLVVCCRAGTAQPFKSSHFTIEQLAPGVYAAIATDNGYAGANAGIVDLGTKTIVFDTFLSPAAAQDLLRAAEQLTRQPVTHVVNSHFHNDHIRGNQVFSPNAEIISTAKTREAIGRIEPEQIKWEIQNISQLLLDAQEAFDDETDPLARRDLTLQLAYCKAIKESQPLLKTRLPSVTFEEKLTIYGTTRKVDLLSVGGGHTPGDCIMLLPDEHIAFVGDLVSIGMHPYLPDGSPEEWKTTLQALEALPIGTIVPGHGTVGHRVELTVMRDYIQTLQILAKDIALRGRKDDNIAHEPVPLRYESWLRSQNFAQSLRFLYSQIVSGQMKK